MLLFKPRNYKVSKNYALSAWAYRKLAISSGINKLKYGAEQLSEQYYFETFGKLKYKERYGRTSPDIHENGYTYGKSLFDITMSSIYEDLANGTFCKYDYLSDAGLPVIIRRNIIKSPCKTFFPYRQE